MEQVQMDQQAFHPTTLRNRPASDNKKIGSLK